MNDLIYSRPQLFDKQRQFIDDSSRFTWIEAGTKSGKTIGMVVWIHERTIKCKKKNKVRWWVAPYYTTSKIAYNRLWNFIPIEYRSHFKKNDTELSITYPFNNNKIYFKSAEKPDALYGEDVQDVVIDEASRMREEAWNAIRSTLTATKGRAKIIGNVKGKKNWFYRYSQQAKAENEGYYRLTSYDNPFLDKEEIDFAKKNLPEDVFKELYLSEPTDDGSNPFGISYIQECVTAMSTKPAICYAIDLAKSFDYTVIIGLDEDGNVCHFDRFQKDWKQTKEIIVNKIGDTYSIIDSTGVGDPIAEDLNRSCRKLEGFKFSQSSKQQIMEGLAVAIQQQNIGFPDGIIKDELESFEFEYTRTGVRYSAPEGQHDDVVCALALAVKIWNEAQTKGKYIIV